MAKYRIKSDGIEYEVTVTDAGVGARVTVEGSTFEVEPVGTAAVHMQAAPVSIAAAAAPAAAPAAAAAGAHGRGSICAPIPGVVTKLCVNVGDSVAADQLVLKLEAMKMENDICSPIGGTVKEIPVNEGAEVKDGQLLVVVE